MYKPPPKRYYRLYPLESLEFRRNSDGYPRAQLLDP